MTRGGPAARGMDVQLASSHHKTHETPFQPENNGESQLDEKVDTIALHTSYEQTEPDLHSWRGMWLYFHWVQGQSDQLFNLHEVSSTAQYWPLSPTQWEYENIYIYVSVHTS
jgi:hypothetical protein